MKKFVFTCVVFLIGRITVAQITVSTFSGNSTPGFINGSTDSARFNGPFGMSIDRNNILYVADGDNHCIRKIDLVNGMVSTLAGTGVAGYKDGAGDTAQFNSPSDLCLDDSGNVYVSDFQNQRIRRISPDGFVITIAGSGVAGYLDAGPSIAKFNYPRGICIDGGKNIYVADSWNHRVRKIFPSGNVTTYAGGGTTIGVGSTGAFVDAADTNARFYTPSGLAIDQHGNIYVADAYNHRIRKIDGAQNVSTLAGSGATGQGQGGHQDGSTSTARFNTPTELFIDTVNDEIYISDTFSNRIRKIYIAADSVITYAGSGATGFNNGSAASATFNYPRGLVFANSISSKLYVVDCNNNSIRLISDSGVTFISSIEKAYVSIFPNPSTGNFYINSTLKTFRLLEVFNGSGKSLLKKEFEESAFTFFQMPGHSPGLYYLRISFSDGTHQIRKIEIL